MENEAYKEMIGIKEVIWGAAEDSFLVEGVAFKKTYVYAGYDLMPKCFD